MWSVNLEDSCCTIISSSGSGPVRGGIGAMSKIGNGSDSDSSSSIGKNSDVTGGEDSGDSTGEVESPYKGGGVVGPLDSMEALEQSLPMRRGISRFYNGKSKSFANLAHASSIQDLAKAENAYIRRSRNLLASRLIWAKRRISHSSPLRGSGSGISKRTFTNKSQTNLALAVAMTATSSEADYNNIATCDNSQLEMNVVPSVDSCLVKPESVTSNVSRIHRDMSPWRSFSSADLQCVGTAIMGSPTTPHSAFGSTAGDEAQTTSD